MEENYALCLDVLRSFERAGVLDEMILVGSWCLPFYRVYFSGTSYHPTIRTRDIDFLVPQPNRRAKRVDVAALLKEKGFVESFSNSGFIQFMHPELIVEFLVPEKGRGSDKPVAVPRLGINAQPLRFLDFLASHAITLKAEGLAVRMPHPAAYGLHKLIVATRRTSREKSLKDLREAIDLLNALIRNGEGAFIKSLYKSMLAGWRSKSKKALKEAGETRLLEMLEKE